MQEKVWPGWFLHFQLGKESNKTFHAILSSRIRASTEKLEKVSVMSGTFFRQRLLKAKMAGKVDEKSTLLCCKQHFCNNKKWHLLKERNDYSTSIVFSVDFLKPGLCVWRNPCLISAARQSKKPDLNCEIRQSLLRTSFDLSNLGDALKVIWKILFKSW